MKDADAAQKQLEHAGEQLQQQQERFQHVSAPGQAEQLFTHKVCLELGEMGTRILEALDAIPPGLPPELRERKRVLTRETLAFLDNMQAAYKQVDQRRAQAHTPAGGTDARSGAAPVARPGVGAGPKPAHSTPPAPSAGHGPSPQRGLSGRGPASTAPQHPDGHAPLPWERAKGAARQYWDKIMR